jgi:hypothetical protein
MHPEALFINGVYASVFDEIIAVQAELPEQILFLQPYSSHTMTKVRDKQPSTTMPMRLFASITSDLGCVHYVGEIVGWENKTELSPMKRALIEKIIKELQPNEDHLYNASPAQGTSVNLLYVRRVRKLPQPFSVTQLTKLNDGKALSNGRQTAGGWAYVQNIPLPG